MSSIARCSSCCSLLFYTFCLAFLCSIPTACAADKPGKLKSREDVEKKIGESIRTFLGGRAMQVGCFVQAPFVIWKGVGKNRRLGGISVDQMQELSNKYNFAVEFFEVKDVDFDGIVAQVGGQNVGGDASVNSTRLIDISVQVITATGTRGETARQTASPVDSGIVFVRKKLPFLRELQSVFIAFAWELWTLLFVVLFFLAANLAFIDCMRDIWPKRRQVDPTTGRMTLVSALRTFRKILANDKRRIGRLYWDQVFNLGSLLFGQLPIRPPDDALSRIMYVLFKAFAFGLAAFYTALLVNQFQARPDSAEINMKKFCNEPQVEGKTLKDVVVGTGTSFQSYILNYLQENADLCPNVGEDVRVLFDDTVPGGVANLCEDLVSCLKLVSDGKAYATLRDSSEARWMLSHEQCDSFEIVGETGSSSATTWILPLDEMYATLGESISNAILLARDDGSFDRISKTAINQDGCKAADLNRVAIRNVIGFLIPMAVMFLIAWLIQFFKCVQADIPCISGSADRDRPVWGTSANVCLCQSLICTHGSHRSTSAQWDAHGADSTQAGGPIPSEMKGAVLVRPLYNSPWEGYIQPDVDSSGESDCPSAS